MPIESVNAHQRGSVFLFILAVLGVLFAVAFGLLSSSRLASTSGAETDPEILSDQAANEALGHAIGAIHQAFLTGGGVPSQLTDEWRSHFWPIDTHRRGETRNILEGDLQRGTEGDPWDYYENDVHVENLMTEFYNYLTKSGHYMDRSGMYAEGHFGHPGTGRWHEPGVLTSDPVNRPLSWHLDHPVAADTSSPDPAVRRGENYLPDRSDLEPIWYDANLRATSDPAALRYRLRYAVAVEALDGHILVTMPGEFAPAGASAEAGGVPTAEDFAAAMEVDRERADRWGSTLYEFGRRLGGGPDSLDLSLRGVGFSHTGNTDGMWSSVYTTGAGTDLMRWVHNDDDWVRTPAEQELTAGRLLIERQADNESSLVHEALGFAPSFEAVMLKKGDGNFDASRDVRVFLYTPFGTAPRAVAHGTRPSAYDEAYVDTPWALNVPTLVPNAITSLLYAYMPQAFKTGRYNRRDVYAYEGQFPDSNGNLQHRFSNNTIRVEYFDPAVDDDARGMVPLIDLFADYADIEDGPYFQRVGGFNLPDGDGDGVPDGRDLDGDGTADWVDLDGDGACDAPGEVLPPIPYPGTDPAFDGDYQHQQAWLDELGDPVLDGAGNHKLTALRRTTLDDGSTVDVPYPWHHRLGQGCKVNEGFPRRNNDGTQSGPEGFASPELVHMSSDSSYARNIFDDFVEKTETHLPPGVGEKWIKRDTGGGGAYNDAGGYFYGNSYWMDLANAYLHTMAACQFVWADHIDGVYEGDPLRGIPTWRYWDNPKTNEPDRGAVADGEPIPADYFQGVSGVTIDPNGPCRDLKADPSKSDADPSAWVPSTFDSMREVDAQFLRNLGEWPEDYATGRRPTVPNVGLELGEMWHQRFSDTNRPNGMPALRYRPFTTDHTNQEYNHANIKGLLNLPPAADDPGTDHIEGPITPEQAAVMELLVNDYRTSFFGASPTYPEFRPLDLDDDGIVRCSVYQNGHAPADPATGRGPLTDPATGQDFKRFSLTGYFTFQKTRHYRIFFRGEVYDVVREVVVGQTNGEAVYCVDPDGDVWNVEMQPNGAAVTGMSDSHLIMKRYHLNNYRGALSNVNR